MSAYERSVQRLYQAALDRFVAERARLAAELRGAGDAAGAKKLAGRRRPTISAWTVNQLHWQAREAFDDMLAAAARVRAGDLGAAGHYRETIATLRKHAAALLTEAGHGAGETVLRRVTATLAALGAAGGFAPDAPGTLAADRDPPGFEAAEGIVSAPRPSAPPGASRPAPAAARRDGSGSAGAARERARRDAERRAERADQECRKAEAARRMAERRRVETKLRAARAALAKRDRTLAQRRHELAAAETAAAAAREAVHELERRLAELDDAG